MTLNRSAATKSSTLPKEPHQLAPMADEATLVLTFDEILAGAAGRQEATAAQRWLDAGAPLQPLPKGLVALDPAGFDMRVAGAQAGKRRRTAAAAPEPPAAVKPAPVKPVKPAAAPAVPQQQMPAQRPQQVQQSHSQQQQQQRLAAAPASTAPLSQAGFSSGGSGLAFRRKGGGPAPFELPASWRQLPAGASGSPGSGAGGTGGKGAKPRKAAGAGKAQQAQQAQQQQAAFMSPEGLAFSSLPDVQAVVEGPVVVPRKLLRWLRQAAANPMAPAALGAPDTVIGRAHLLAARRARVATVAADRQQWERRLALAAADHASAERLRRRRSDG